MTATGSRAARLLSNIPTAEWRSSIGPNIRGLKQSKGKPAAPAQKRDDPRVRIAVATDAWHPQVNGVVRSVSTTVDHLPRHRPPGRGHPSVALSGLSPSDLSGNMAGTWMRLDRSAVTRRILSDLRPRLDRKAHRLGSAELVREEWRAVHDRLSHALPRLCLHSHRHPGRMDLEGHAPLPWAGGAHLPGHAPLLLLSFTRRGSRTPITGRGAST